MRNFKLIIEYDGTGFSGWQIQPDRRTVQGEIHRALTDIASNDVKIIGAGRTDAGVHAVGQVASVKLETGHDAGTIGRMLRAELPRDILVRRVEEIHDSFHARFDALSRTYHYVFVKRRTALWRDRFLPIPADTDIGAMRGTAAMLTGERDFTAFSTMDDESRTTVCKVSESTLLLAGPVVVYRVRANRFLYNMVRRIAGVLLAAGRGKRVDIESILGSGDRSRTGTILPPSALYLMRVEYESPRKIG